LFRRKCPYENCCFAAQLIYFENRKISEKQPLGSKYRGLHRQLSYLPVEKSRKQGGLWSSHPLTTVTTRTRKSGAGSSKRLDKTRRNEKIRTGTKVGDCRGGKKWGLLTGDRQLSLARVERVFTNGKKPRKVVMGQERKRKSSRSDEAALKTKRRPRETGEKCQSRVEQT